MITSVSTVATSIKRGIDKELYKKELSRKDEAIMKTIYAIANKYKRTFCNPRIKTIQQILKKRYNMVVPERTLRLHLRILEAKKYLIVKKRAGRLKTGQLIGMANFYFITKKMRHYLKGMIKQIIIWISKDKSLLNNIYSEIEEKTANLFIKANYMSIKNIKEKKKVII